MLPPLSLDTGLPGSPYGCVILQPGIDREHPPLRNTDAFLSFDFLELVVHKTEALLSRLVRLKLTWGSFPGLADILHPGQATNHSGRQRQRSLS